VQLFLAIFVFFEGNLISADQTCKKVVDLRNAVDKIAKEVEQTCCKSCHRGSEDHVVNGNVYYDGNYPSDTWRVQNLLTWSVPEIFPNGGNFANYWLAPNKYQGAFVLKFDQPRTVSKITVVNTHNGGLNDRGTRTFEVYLGDSAYGPWTRVVYSTLPDPRKTDRRISSVPAYSYSISPRCAQYVRFRIVSWYGSGGGLQYFSTCPLGCDSGWKLHQNKCYKKFSRKTQDITWTSANNNCNDEGGELASIADLKTNSFVKTFVSHNKRMYIGGIRSGPNSFTWTDGTPCLYTDWSKGQPDNAHGKEFCTEFFNTDKKWNDQPCHHYSSNDYLCQKPTNY